MSGEERILAVLGEIQKDINDLKKGQAGVEKGLTKLERELKKVRAEFKTELKKVRVEFKTEIHKSTGFLLDEIDRRVDFEGWTARQKEKLLAKSVR